MMHIVLLFIIPLVMLLYFELLGRFVSYKLCNYSLISYYPLGFIAFQAVLYLTSILTNYQVSFYVLLMLFIAIISISIILIVVNIKEIDHTINLKCIVLISLVAIYLTYFSYNTTLGNISGFDTTQYLNIVSQNIKNSHINSKDLYLNGIPEMSMSYYSSETYYYFGSVFVFVVCKLFQVVGINMYYGTTFIWTFQLLFNLSLSALVIEIKRFIKNKCVYLAISIPIIFVYGKLYYNSVFGFFGNTWYTLMLGYAGMFLYEYLNSFNKKYRLMIYLVLFGICSMTTSGIYTILFFLYALFFLSYKEENLLKEYGVVLLLPLYNALFMERISPHIYILIPFILCGSAYFFGNSFQIMIKKRKAMVFFLIISFVLFFVLSRLFSNGIFDFSGFFNNLSQRADMTLDYFNYQHDSLIIKVYKVFILTLLIMSSIFNRKSKIVVFGLLLFIIFFNPLCCNFINRYISVYYRSYSIIINPFILSVLFDELLGIIDSKKIVFCISLSVASMFVLSNNILKPIIYNYEFIPEEKYNRLFKMSDNEIDIINELKNNIYYYGDKEPYIVTNNLLTLSMLPQGKYIYGRSYIKSKYWSESEEKIYEIFYEPKYLGDSLSDDPDYDNMSKYIKDAKIDYIVVDKKTELFDKKKEDYTYLYYKVNELCKVFPVYENDRYALYRFSY